MPRGMGIRLPADAGLLEKYRKAASSCGVMRTRMGLRG